MNKKPQILPDIGGVFCFVMFTALIAVGGKNILRGGDTFWHIKAGEIMLERGALLTTDIFSHTAYGKAWTAHEWLSEIIMAAIHQVTGLDGVAVFFLLIASFSYWLLFRFISRLHNEGIAAFCVTVSALLSMPHLLVRPHVFTWFFGVATLYILMTKRDRIYLLPIISVIWANLHGGFLIGMVLQAIFIAGSILDDRPSALADFRGWLGLLKINRKPIFILMISVLAVSILNPFGYKLFLFPFQVTKEIFMNHISEWLPPNLREGWYFRYYLIGLFFILTFNLHRINWTNRLLLLFFINLALSHIRHISLAGLFLAPLLAELLTPWHKRATDFFTRKKAGSKQLSLSPVTGPLATLLMAVSLLVFSYLNYGQAQKKTPVIFTIPEKFPAQAVRYLKENPPEGKMFNEYFIGGYLIYTMGPSQKVFIDGRADMYGEKIFGDYRKIIHLDEEPDRLLDEYEIEWVISPIKQRLPLYLKACGKWTELYRDKQVTILKRKQS